MTTQYETEFCVLVKDKTSGICLVILAMSHTVAIVMFRSYAKQNIQGYDDSKAVLTCKDLLALQVLKG